MASLPTEIDITLDIEAKEIIVRFTEALEAFSEAIIAASIAIQDFRLAVKQVEEIKDDDWSENRV